MREPFRDKDRLLHILTAMQVIEEGVQTYSKEEILGKKIIYYGFVKQIEIIGEAANMLTHEFRDNHPQVAWRPIVNMRNVLVHDYIHISAEMLWDTITKDIPNLKPHIKSFYEELQ